MQSYWSIINLVPWLWCILRYVFVEEPQQMWVKTKRNNKKKNLITSNQKEQNSIVNSNNVIKDSLVSTYCFTISQLLLRSVEIKVDIQTF